MQTYLLIGLPFIGLVLLLDTVLLKTWVVRTKQCWVVMACMLAMTLVFNQLLTGLPIVTYNEAHISGIKLGFMPIEDLLYTVAAVIGIGSMLTYGKQRNT